MMEISIGIQARSTSSRFPGKVFELIDGKEMLLHVVQAADKAAFYLNRNSPKSGFRVSFAILCPDGDPIAKKYQSRVTVLGGSENDVLSRYVDFAKKMDSSYIVRITGDCPLIPPYLITKLIKIAHANSYDYCSNVDENYRTAIDGYDVEVISRRALEWADQNAKEPRDREHVTTILRTAKFSEKHSTGMIVGHLNQSHLKLSVDTTDDLEAVRVEKERMNKCLESAQGKFGRKHVHQI